MGFGSLFIMSSISVMKVLLVTGLGAYLALDRVNILGDDARKHMNIISFFVFAPALISSNLAKTITFQTMIKLWFMPINILFTFIFGSILGWVVIQITRAPAHLRGLIIGCCAAGNLGNLPFIIIPAICKERGSLFGDPNACHTSGMAYASLAMAIGAIYLWSYVYNIVRVSLSRSSKGVEISDSSAVKPTKEGSSSPSEGSWTEPKPPSSNFPGAVDHESGLALPLENTPQVSGSNKIKLTLLEMLIKKMNLKRLFAPSTIGALAGFVVGLLPQIRKLIIGDTAPLRVVQDTALLLGDGAIPVTTLIMGGNLLKGLKGSGIQKSMIFSILLVRYVALPLIGVGIIKGAVRFGLVHDNPLYEFVLLLQYSLPPAMSMGTITQLFGAGESECSVILLWSYSLAPVALTLWSTLFLWVVS